MKLHRKLNRIATARRFNIKMLIVFIILASVGGVYVVYRSNAATYGHNPYMYATAVDVRTGATVPNVDIRVRSTDDQRYCITPYTPTDGGGHTYFWSCQLGGVDGAGRVFDHYYVYYAAAPPGYQIADHVG
ncbi:MAG TPA: hypothetical protein VF272_02560, partial [Candidatus Saccharimonadia bacterium]